jgi:hypothetical protein
MASARDHRHKLGTGGFTELIDAASVLPRTVPQHNVPGGDQLVQLKRVHAQAARPLLQGGGLQVGEKTSWAFCRALEPGELGHGLLHQVPITIHDHGDSHCFYGKLDRPEWPARGMDVRRHGTCGTDQAMAAPVIQSSNLRQCLRAHPGLASLA